MPITKSNIVADLTKLSLAASDIPSVNQLSALFNLHKNNLKKAIQKLKIVDRRLLDETVHRMHEEAFGFFECSSCGNCCKSISPGISRIDVDHIAKQLRIRPSEVVTRYMIMDEDGDYVFNVQPCPFINSENHCSIYSCRPKACKEYPHTDRQKFHQILDLSYHNAGVCPVVFAILKKISTVMLQK